MNNTVYTASRYHSMHTDGAIQGPTYVACVSPALSWKCCKALSCQHYWCRATAGTGASPAMPPQHPNRSHTGWVWPTQGHFWAGGQWNRQRKGILFDRAVHLTAQIQATVEGSDLCLQCSGCRLKQPYWGWGKRMFITLPCIKLLPPPHLVSMYSRPGSLPAPAQFRMALWGTE